MPIRILSRRNTARKKIDAAKETQTTLGQCQQASPDTEKILPALNQFAKQHEISTGLRDVKDDTQARRTAINDSRIPTRSDAAAARRKLVECAR